MDANGVASRNNSRDSAPVHAGARRLHATATKPASRNATRRLPLNAHVCKPFFVAVKDQFLKSGLQLHDRKLLLSEKWTLFSQIEYSVYVAG